MRRNLIWAAVVAATALIQTTWLEAIRIQGVVPNLVLILVVYLAIVDGEERAMFTGALGGLLEDVAADTALGHHVLCNVVVAYAVGRLATRLVTEHAAVKTGLVFCGALAQGVLYTAIQYVQQPRLNASKAILSGVIPAVFYTALVAPIVLLVLSRLFRRDSPLQGGPG